MKTDIEILAEVIKIQKEIHGKILIKEDAKPAILAAMQFARQDERSALREVVKGLEEIHNALSNSPYEKQVGKVLNKLTRLIEKLKG